MRKILYSLLILLFIAPNANCMENDMNAKNFIEDVVSKIEPIVKDDSLFYWKATTTGKPEWYKKYEEKEIEYKRFFADKERFEKVKGLKKEKFKDPLIKRQIDILYDEFLENQIEPKLNEEIVRMGSELEKKFNTFRAKIAGQEAADNRIREILQNSKNEKKRIAAWEASKQIGKVAAGGLIALVKKRNEAARGLGFKNYYEMRLEFQEQSVGKIFSLLNKLYKETAKPYAELKNEIDSAVAKKFGVSADEVKPWHYEDVFFQEAPKVYEVDLDKYFKGKDILKLVRDYYAGIGMPVDDILKRSDLFERKGKEQHAYCIHIDKKGDVRILANIKNNEHWAGTMLHELGHAVYEKYLDKDLPFLLRDPAHTFTTEGIAELFGRLTNNAEWLAEKVAPTEKKELSLVKKNLEKSLRAHMLIFSRWVMVMANFERALYSNPDQNLNELWWTLVEKYQFIKKPGGRDNPDWAAKIHLTTSPVYYHNYLLGEIFASQLTHYIDKNIAPKETAFINGGRKLGVYLKEKVFALGDRMRWDEFVKFATGESLTPKYFAEDFINQ